MTRGHVHLKLTTRKKRKGGKKREKGKGKGGCAVLNFTRGESGVHCVGKVGKWSNGIPICLVTGSTLPKAGRGDFLDCDFWPLSWKKEEEGDDFFT